MIWSSPPWLASPTLEYASSLLAMVQEYASAGERRQVEVPNLRSGDVAGYITYLTLRADSYDLKPAHVPQHTYWLVDRGDIIGTSRLRPILTPQLYEWGGHISYDIRPSRRRRGLGTLLLALTLDRARKMRLSRVRLMCYQDNIASAKVIENNGGIQIFAGPCALAGGEIITYEIAL